MAKRKATREERAYMEVVASLGCVVCRNLGHGITPATIHHIRAGQGLSQRAGHHLVIPLCKPHHQDGGKGVAFHADERAFEKQYGTEQQLLDQTIGDVVEAFRMAM